MTTKIKHITAICNIKSIDRENRTVTALVSTPSIDRDREIIEAQAFKKHLGSFMKNPVMLAGHRRLGQDGQSMVIGSWLELKITDKGLLGKVQFATTNLGEEYWKLYSEKHQRAFSIGFREIQFADRTEKINGVDIQVRAFTEVELIEISAVAIPANADALIQLSAEKSITESLTKTIEKAVAVAVAAELEKQLEEQLNTEAGGKMHMLILDVAEALHRSLNHGVDDVGDIHNDATHAKSTIPDVGDGDLTALQKALDEAACKMHGD